MNIIRHMEFFNPVDVKEFIHIIGIGAIGSHVAIMLARMGLTRLHLYDFDDVGTENISNQSYYLQDVKRPKLDALADQLTRINPEVQLKLSYKGYHSQPLSGYVFLCVDSIELRKDITTENKYHSNIKAMFDFRMGLEEAQHYAADWSITEHKDIFIKSMQFTEEEAKEAMPVSACGTSMCVIPTIWSIVAAGIANFIKLTKGEPIEKCIICNPFSNITLTL